MEDNYMDKKLKKILENPPEMKPDFQAIADMKKRLEEAKAPKKKKRGGAASGWLLPLLILPFLLSSLFYYHKYSSLDERLNALTSQITQTKQDTIQKTYITYQYDTIYNVIYKEVTAPTSTRRAEKPAWTFGGGYNSKLLSLFSNDKFSDLSEQRNARTYNPYRPLGLGLNSGWTSASGGSSDDLKTQEEENLWLNTASQYIGSLPLGLLDYPSDFNEKDKLVLSETEFDPEVNPLLYFIPKGGNLSVSGMPIALGSGNGAGFTGFSFGLSGALRFYQDVEMELGVERLQVGLQFTDQAEVSPYPVLPPDTPGDLFKELYVDLSYLQIPLMLRKYFRSDKKLMPFGGIGLVATRPLQQKFAYEYINGTVGEYYTRATLSEGEFAFNNWRAALGARYMIGDKLSAQAEFMYQYGNSQGPGEYFTLRFGGLSLGLNYRFE